MGIGHSMARAAGRYSSEVWITAFLSPLRVLLKLHFQPGLAPWAVLFRRFTAGSPQLRHESSRPRNFLSHSFRLLPLLLVASAALFAQQEAPPGDPILDGLKGKIASTSAGDRPKLCLQIAERQMAETSKLYAASEDDKAQPALTDVVAYSELARDYAIQSHKHQKQTEIAVRGMARKLTEILHTLGRDEQAPVRDALTRLQKVRDDLLAAMFSKGAK